MSRDFNGCRGQPTRGALAAGSFAPLGIGLAALDVVFQPVHEASPHGVATRAVVAQLLPPAVREAQHRLLAVALDRPAERRTGPFGLTAGAGHHHRLARDQPLYPHVKDDGAPLETELGFAADPGVHDRVGGPPAPIALGG